MNRVQKIGGLEIVFGIRIGHQRTRRIGQRGEMEMGTGTQYIGSGAGTRTEAWMESWGRRKS